MVKEMRVLLAVLLGVGAACLAAPPAEPDPIGESLNVVAGVAEGSFNVVAEAAEGTAQTIADLAGGAATTFERDLLTMPGVFLGKDVMSATGLTVGVSSMNIYQQNTRGGMSTNDRNGRFNGSYSLEVAADFERLLGLEGIGFYTSADGAWSKSGDIDGDSVGSYFGVNGEGGARRSLDITQLWFEGAMFDGTLRVRAGKMDIAGGFECGGQPVAFDSGT
jgi:carbohydrate-selective porin OprB